MTKLAWWEIFRTRGSSIRAHEQEIRAIVEEGASLWELYSRAKNARVDDATYKACIGALESHTEQRSRDLSERAYELAQKLGWGKDNEDE